MFVDRDSETISFSFARFKGVNVTESFSNTRSNVRSSPNFDEIKHQYSFRICTRVDTGELKKTASLARGPGFESPYHQDANGARLGNSVPES